ncbi:unnamed protein product [Periconia digitata]|uniref:Uncharacterized protein n=1 Tax=Periconia digitata TaxID=1303443 RepID=A0A9W4UGZ2_9PLEO|nr:unnamed protein product [Periconia digitata]
MDTKRDYEARDPQALVDELNEQLLMCKVIARVGLCLVGLLAIVIVTGIAALLLYAVKRAHDWILDDDNSKREALIDEILQKVGEVFEMRARRVV